MMIDSFIYPRVLPTPTAGVLLGSGERAEGYGAEGYVRRGNYYLANSGWCTRRVDVVQR
jgi:hypothetical protein